ncbi:F510_1955 family glycosylhydrolase [Halobacillus sp. SY10]|uniref:F510_1955 family glycosylhydrolase n=1 Tax=Halobacillus sp. SY10 TaxID=3381356 RepID=UPI0038799036
MKMRFTLLILASITAIAGCSQSEQESNQKEGGKESLQTATESFDGSIEHVHGMGYVDGETIAYAAHSGVKLFQDGDWMESKYHKNDYMGFNAVDDGFYTSGHPGKQSDLPNPVGLQKGDLTDEDLSALAFEGEVDFHAMGVGAINHAIYVLNERPNSEMDKGLYKSTDEGETWKKIKAENLGEKIFQIAVHPDDENIVAVASATGIYFSEDGGETFKMISEQGQGSGLYFTKDRLFYGLYTGEPLLKKYDWNDQSKENMKLPELKEDAVMYISKNPDTDGEFVIFTIKGNSYMTTNSGEAWKQIIDQGKTK